MATSWIIVEKTFNYYGYGFNNENNKMYLINYIEELKKWRMVN